MTGRGARFVTKSVTKPRGGSCPRKDQPASEQVLSIGVPRRPADGRSRASTEGLSLAHVVGPVTRLFRCYALPALLRSRSLAPTASEIASRAGAR